MEIWIILGGQNTRQSRERDRRDHGIAWEGAAVSADSADRAVSDEERLDARACPEYGIGLLS